MKLAWPVKLTLWLALFLLSSNSAIGQISRTISEACNIRTEAVEPGSLVYFWYTNSGDLRYSSVPLTTDDQHPPSTEEHYNVFLAGEIGFCFVPQIDETPNEETYSAMVIKEALIGRQVINDKVYLTIGDAIQNRSFSWDTWQNMGRETASNETRKLNSILRGVKIEDQSSILDYSANLVFSGEYSGDEIKRTVDVVRWRNTGNIKFIPWYHSPRDRANNFEAKVLEIFVIQQLSHDRAPRTFVIRFEPGEKR